MELGAADRVKHQGHGKAEIASRRGTRQHSRTPGATSYNFRAKKSQQIWQHLKNINSYFLCSVLCYRLTLLLGPFLVLYSFAEFTMMRTCFLCLYINCILFPRTAPFNLIKFSSISPATTLSIAFNHTHLLAVFTIAPASSIGSHRFLIFPVYLASPCG